MTTVSSGQTLNISSVQTSTGLTVLSGGTVDVLSGGTDVGAILSGGYQAVYSPTGNFVAYVKNVRGKPGIFIWSRPGIVPIPTRKLTAGTEPDWQPVPVPPPPT